MNNISENITYKEATNSPTATRLGINNKPDEYTLRCMEKVAKNCFEPLRKWYGKPIKINSFYRSNELNTAIGGANNSQHTQGEAIDIDAGDDNYKLFNWIKNNIDFDTIIWEFGDEKNPDWVHISYTERRPNRNQILKAVKVGGSTVYKVL